MKPTTSPYKHIFYNPNRVRKKSGEKHKKAIERKIDLLKKLDHNGPSRWIDQTMKRADARLKLFGINATMIEKKIASKGLSHLLSKSAAK